MGSNPILSATKKPPRGVFLFWRNRESLLSHVSEKEKRPDTKWQGFLIAGSPARDHERSE
jgi:hypothetical protein